MSKRKNYSNNYFSNRKNLYSNKSALSKTHCESVVPFINAISDYYSSMVPQTGVIFDTTSHGPILKIYGCTPTKHQLEQIQTAEPVLTKVLEIEDILILLFKFGDLSWEAASHNVNIGSDISNLPIELEIGSGLELTIELYDISTKTLVLKRVITLNHDLSLQILKILKKQLETPFNEELYYKKMREISTQYLPEQLVLLASDKSCFENLKEMEQEWNSKHTGPEMPKYYQFTKPMSHQVANDMMELAVILKRKLDIECFFILHGGRFWYKNGKLYGNDQLLSEEMSEEILGLLSQTGLLYQVDYLNARGANIRLV